MAEHDDMHELGRKIINDIVWADSDQLVDRVTHLRRAGLIYICAPIGTAPVTLHVYHDAWGACPGRLVCSQQLEPGQTVAVRHQPGLVVTIDATDPGDAGG
jgi:hypothetical protein